MGRMLETLKLGEARRAAPTMATPSAEVAAQDCVVEWEIGEEVPFVEVGGPNKKVELSPGLLAHPPQPIPRPPHHVVEAAAIAPAAVVPTPVVPPVAAPMVSLAPAPTPSAKLTPTPPMIVAYEACTIETPATPGVSADILAYHQPEHPIAKEYGRLLDTMLQGLKAAGPRVLLFLGWKPHVGASTVILNLGTIAAQAKSLRVAVVEGNGANGGLAQRLGHANRAGLHEVIAGTVGLEHALVKTGIGTLHLLPAGEKPAPIGAEAMTWLCAWLRERYDLVLIEGPTLDEPAALAIQAPHATGIYLVLPEGESAAGKGQAIHRLGGRLCGLIHTRFEI